MPTLDLSRNPPAIVASDPIDGEGCHVVTVAQPGNCRGWVRRIPPAGRPVEIQPTRSVSDYKRLGDGCKRLVYTDLKDGMYQGQSAVSCPQKGWLAGVMIRFLVIEGRIRLPDPDLKTWDQQPSLFL